MYDDEYKNPGQWEVVGGKTSSKPKGKTATNKMNGAGTKSGAAPKPIIKVDELGKVNSNRTRFGFKKK